ncbi:hypothetical protein PN462_19160 [Spirulina sp. CS-785/01]|uniref:hypothetical protein n=1 Tax=Spirulina sp. CS-785/01 TaxID=3021716 RepID=UPI00232E38D7|nr:hypothetical protein [Spirulina sp. CS-785/01]MDB9315242.1 hypothetical protein [Spirulina sp. CS-785/01]
MSLLLCPGFHEEALTQSFLQEMGFLNAPNVLVFPTHTHPPYAGGEIYRFLQEKRSHSSQSVAVIAFSAGVVGGMRAAIQAQNAGLEINAFFALDGWGVPQLGNFPLYRLSHDHFTHWSSALLGEGKEGFYADPPVEHLQLWATPRKVRGWWEQGNGLRSLCCAADFILDRLPQT